jgi:mannose-6-phosphate isomerase-like protein (cupin superfamily)
LIYHLNADEPDRQSPHTEDEIYYVLSGEGVIDIAGEAYPLKPRTIIFVEKQVEHRFRDYPEGLTLLVVFAPARGTLAT